MSQTGRPKMILSFVFALIVLAGVCFPLLVPAQGDRRDRGRSALSLSATVLIDPQGMVYFSKPEGAIAAVRFESGAQIWTTPKGKMYRPLAISGKFLVAQQEGGETKAGKYFGVAYLSLLDGGEHLVTRVELPPSAWVSIKDGLGSSLRTSAVAGLNDKVTIAWASERKPQVRGIAPDDEDAENVQPVKAQVEVHSGALDIDASGRIRPQSPPVAPRQLLEAPRQDLPEGQRLKGLPEAQYISADRNHILVSEMLGDDRDLNKYRWTIYSGATREPVGAINTPFPTAPFFVSGSTLIYQLRPFTVREPGDKMVRSPLKLVAIDLRTGSKLWEHPILDIEYYGPFPP